MSDSLGAADYPRPTFDLSALDAQIEQHEKANSSRSILSWAVTKLWHEDQSTLADLDKLSIQGHQLQKSGDAERLHQLESRFESKIAADQDALDTTNSFGQYGTGFLKTASLFVGGQKFLGRIGLAGLALTTLCYGLDRATMGDTGDTLAKKVLLGGLEGGLTKGAFWGLSQLDIGSQTGRGVLLGMAGRGINAGVEAALDPETTGASVGVQRVLRTVFNPTLMTTDAGLALAGAAASRSFNWLLDGAAQSRPLYSSMITSASFGLSSGAFQSYADQVKNSGANSSIDYGKIIKHALVQGLIDGVAGIPGGLATEYELHHPQQLLTQEVHRAQSKFPLIAEQASKEQLSKEQPNEEPASKMPEIKSPASPQPGTGGTTDAATNTLLNDIEHQHFLYFLDQSDPETHLALDRSRKGAPSSTAAVGFELTSLPIGVERGWITRERAAGNTLKILKTLWDAPQSDAPTGVSGTHGLFYHFIDPRTALRAGDCEVSTIDTALLMAGDLAAKNYFRAENPTETSIRDYADKLYERVDWNWAMDNKPRMTLGWTPEKGFLPYEWGGYNEAMIMLLMAMGSPTHPIPKESWTNYDISDRVTNFGGETYINFPAMYAHQYSHAWIDFRGIEDGLTRKLGFDYFENSRRAALAQNYYAQQNPLHWKGYDALNWGLTACDGPGDAVVGIPGGQQGGHKFLDYSLRGAPDAPDDGTIAPTAAAASLPFVPELTIPTLKNWRLNHPELWGANGFTDAFNPTAAPDKPSGWVDPERLGIDQGPIVLMTENYRSGFVWDLMKREPAVVNGLKQAGFSGGWLDNLATKH